jgi:hypothetical protein
MSSKRDGHTLYLGTQQQPQQQRSSAFVRRFHLQQQQFSKHVIIYLEIVFAMNSAQCSRRITHVARAYG